MRLRGSWSVVGRAALPRSTRPAFVCRRKSCPGLSPAGRRARGEQGSRTRKSTVRRFGCRVLHHTLPSTSVAAPIWLHGTAADNAHHLRTFAPRVLWSTWGGAGYPVRTVYIIACAWAHPDHVDISSSTTARTSTSIVRTRRVPRVRTVASGSNDDRPVSNMHKRLSDGPLDLG